MRQLHLLIQNSFLLWSATKLWIWKLLHFLDVYLEIIYIFDGNKRLVCSKSQTHCNDFLLNNKINIWHWASLIGSGLKGSSQHWADRTACSPSSPDQREMISCYGAKKTPRSKLVQHCYDSESLAILLSSRSRWAGSNTIWGTALSLGSLNGTICCRSLW